jgi:hypothetical protein
MDSEKQPNEHSGSSDCSSALDSIAEQAFNDYVSKYDTESDEWQDKGVNEYFIAGFKAGLKMSSNEHPDMSGNQKQAAGRLEGLSKQIEQIRLIAVSDRSSVEKVAYITAKIDGVVGG